MMTTAFRPSIAMTFATVTQERARFLAYCRDFHDELVVVDLEQVQQCDSAGLALLIEMKRMTKADGRQVKMINMLQETEALAQFYGIIDFL